MTRDKLEKHTIFTDWGFPKISIIEYPANNKSIVIVKLVTYQLNFCFKNLIGILSPFKN